MAPHLTKVDKVDTNSKTNGLQLQSSLPKINILMSSS